MELFSKGSLQGIWRHMEGKQVVRRYLGGALAWNWSKIFDDSLNSREISWLTISQKCRIFGRKWETEREGPAVVVICQCIRSSEFLIIVPTRQKWKVSLSFGFYDSNIQMLTFQICNAAVEKACAWGSKGCVSEKKMIALHSLLLSW